MADDPQSALPLTNGAAASSLSFPDAAVLLDDIRQLIQSARQRTAQAVNAELTLLHWHIGLRIRTDILQQTRADYGERVVETLAQHLTQEFGRGYARRSLFNMIRFAEVFAEAQIVQTLSAQLGWSHFLELLPLDKPLQREFYAQMCLREGWSVRTLRAKINGKLYERTALADKPEEVVRRELAALRDEDRMTPDLVFRNPYVLDFLQLTGAYSEQDLETAILRDMEAFLLELGADFTFAARQKRMSVDGRDFYLDLLFFHRGLRRLIAVELKLGAFEPAHKGQMELYLRWLDRYERRAGEEAPIGLILCTEATPHMIELMQLDQGDIRVAEYLTTQLPTDLLQRRLRQAVAQGKEQLALQARKYCRCGVGLSLCGNRGHWHGYQKRRNCLMPTEERRRAGFRPLL